MSFLKEYSKIIGLLAFAFVIIILLSPSSMIFARQITIIDTELYRASGNESSVRTKFDFGNNEFIKEFPMEIGEWRGIEYNATKVAGRLDADVMLMRAYSHPKLYQPAFFLILQSSNRSSFHPPIVCYPALGYEIEEEGDETINIEDISWIESPFMSISNDSTAEGFDGTINVKKLIVYKESDGKVNERRVVLYFYVKDNPLSTDNVTMVRVSAIAPTTGSYEGTLDICKDFTSEAIPQMFELRKEGDIMAVKLIENGILGWILLLALILCPFLLVFYLNRN